MESPGPAFRRRLLLDSLTVLAADAPAQAAWLAEYGVLTDELALDFDHAFRMAEALVKDGQLDRAVLSDLRQIDALLSAMSGAENSRRWTTDGLSVDEGWSRTRQLARKALVAELGEWQWPLPVITVVR